MAVRMTYASKKTWNGPKLVGAVKAAARLGTRKAAERLRAYAVPLAPLDNGPLRASAKVSGVNAEPIALVSFNTPYAVRQHEELDYHHDDGQAKYLEEPLHEHAQELYGIVGTEIRNAISRG